MRAPSRAPAGRVDFANILLAGPCNLRCPACIGGALPGPTDASTLDRFPLPGLDGFARRLAALGVTEVSLTGTNTEPMLYRHARALVARLRERVPGVRLSLHTNGTLVLRDPDTFHLYDRATISFPSFEPATYAAMTGGGRVLDLPRVLARARIPVKVSVLVDDANEAELPSLLARLRTLRPLGLRRVVLRRRHGEARARPGLDRLLAGAAPGRCFGGNPVYDLDGLEITVWDFGRSTLSCLNLFADGSIGEEYELARCRRAG